VSWGNARQPVVISYYADAAGGNHGLLLTKRGFEILDFPGSIFQCNCGISANGDVVGFYESVDGKFHTFVLSKETSTTIDLPGAAATGLARDITGTNPGGDIVGNYTSTDGKLHGFL